jgi:hypothetical protein
MNDCACAFSTATSSTATSHFSACDNLRGCKAASKHWCLRHRYAPRPERLPLGSSLSVPSGVRTILIRSRFGRLSRQAMQLRNGTCLRGFPGNDFYPLCVSMKTYRKVTTVPSLVTPASTARPPTIGEPRLTMSAHALNQSVRKAAHYQPCERPPFFPLQLSTSSSKFGERTDLPRLFPFFFFPFP